MWTQPQSVSKAALFGSVERNPNISIPSSGKYNVSALLVVLYCEFKR